MTLTAVLLILFAEAFVLLAIALLLRMGKERSFRALRPKLRASDADHRASLSGAEEPPRRRGHLDGVRRQLNLLTHFGVVA